MNINLKETLQVMLIDDNDVDHFLVTRLFQKEGFTKPVLSFSAADDALLFLRNNPEQLPGLILLDINMPGMNGFDFLDAFALLNERIHQHCKIVMLSSSLSSADMQRAEQHPHVHAYLTKPLMKEKLPAILELLG